MAPRCATRGPKGSQGVTARVPDGAPEESHRCTNGIPRGPQDDSSCAQGVPGYHKEPKGAHSVHKGAQSDPAGANGAARAPTRADEVPEGTTRSARAATEAQETGCPGGKAGDTGRQKVAHGIEQTRGTPRVATDAQADYTGAEST